MKYLYTRSASVVVAEEDQSNLLKKVGFNNKSRLSAIEGKKYLWKCICYLWRSTFNS